ncbi:hypothetical protein [uncultured Pleomorphomonas sp.]|nr:hypothetical protein [uncultured Pleomorphomonas sp.]
MAAFPILTGSALKSAIAGRAKAAASFTEREHQLAASCLMHVEQHSCPSHLNALYQATPTNYRAGLVSWSVAFGRVTFDKDTGAFAYAKGKKTDVDGMLAVAPANFEKQSKTTRTEKEFDVAAYLAKVVDTLTNKDADPRILQAVKGALNLAKMPAPAKKAEKAEKPAKPAAAKAPKVADQASASDLFAA